MSFFNDVHMTASGGADAFPLVFVESSRVQVYPCGKRRAKIDNTKYMPFDPESRLNTEANNRKHVGKNGFTQTYLGNSSLVDENDNLILVLDGYYFTINMLGSSINNAADFAAAFRTVMRSGVTATSSFDAVGYDPNFNFASEAKIYANIRVERVDLFKQQSLGLAYKTTALRKQSAAEVPCLDIYNGQGNSDAINQAAYYYFSGLSFSTTPLRDVTTDYYSVSLCILERNNGTWQVCQASLLPDISHGVSENSIVVGDVTADNVVANTIKLSDGKSVPSLELLNNEGTYRLRFSQV